MFDRFKDWLHGYGPRGKHDGWGYNELEPIIEDVEAAQVRLHSCGNIQCSSKPMPGSIFCWDCMMVENEPVRCVRFPSMVQPKTGYVRKYIVALSILIQQTTLAFTKLEVLYSLAFDGMLVGKGKHATLQPGIQLRHLP